MEKTILNFKSRTLMYELSNKCSTALNWREKLKDLYMHILKFGRESIYGIVRNGACRDGVWVYSNLYIYPKPHPGRYRSEPRPRNKRLEIM